MRLSSAYLRAVLGLDIRDASIADDDVGAMIQRLDWGDAERPSLELFRNLVRKSAPYLPRGGFTRSAPSRLAVMFSDWLQQQPEPLVYDLGTATGKREVIFASGGLAETLRVLFHALSVNLERTPAHVYLYHCPLPAHVTSFPGLSFKSLPDDEHAALAVLTSSEGVQRTIPAFVIIGTVTTEETRRSLRALSLDHPIFFLETNNAPNHLSLAREARLIDRVVRFLTPSIFSHRLRDLSLTFVAGNAEYLSLLETFHFQLKGTPSASEVELTTFLVERFTGPQAGQAEAGELQVEPPLETPGFILSAETTLNRRAFKAERHLDAILDSFRHTVDGLAGPLTARAMAMLDRVVLRGALPAVDRFSDMDAAAVLSELTQKVDDPRWTDDLQRSYLNAFSRHHPEYDIGSCTVISGSSRTALSLLGFHCGIREVVIPDLSWTYEHCFPSVQAVPLTPEFALQPDAILEAVDARLRLDPRWTEYGAVVLNNPHNATGRVFDNGSVQRLLQGLLDRGVTVVDDLSYQNVAPSDHLPDIPTLRQIADALVRGGAIPATRADLLVTVHSMSKTDCLAGARLSVVEIRHPGLRDRFRTVTGTIKPNVGAILLTYLFYRNSLEVPRAYWRLRNQIFRERMEALDAALHNLPSERNPFDIEILAPTGSMYPLMIIQKLPPGLSLEWVASGLARQGIGMIPLTTFARTEKGFDTGRKAFRLTLGGTDGAPILLKKTRRVLIDLNRLIAEEAARYSRRQFAIKRTNPLAAFSPSTWTEIERGIRERVLQLVRNSAAGVFSELRDESTRRALMESFLPERMSVFRQRYIDRAFLLAELTADALADRGTALGETLGREFYKDNLARREEAFRNRLFDRTVHPTQMYSIRAEAAMDAILHSVLAARTPGGMLLAGAAQQLVAEFLGSNVAINSGDEADEIILDLDAHIAAELYANLQGDDLPHTFLSFWGDWDGSNRPSGQGQRLVASVLLKNIERLSLILRMLVEREPSGLIQPEFLSEIEQLPGRTKRFVGLFNEITALTHQLERRYRGILPFHAKPGKFRQVGMALHLARDPVTSLWYHNDRLERRMLELRRERREALEYYFALNKRLRKELHRLVPAVLRHLGDPAFVREAVMYRDLLKRFLITPRIHQNMVTDQDPFAIDTTVFNIMEINEIGARYGNPGIVLALQVSMSTKPEALIELDRKVRGRREHVLRDHPDIDLPALWLVPLFEDRAAVLDITGYVKKLWEYALQSRRLNQETHDRFSEIIEELFIAGSDLSQQMGQAAGAHLYRHAKYDVLHWLAEHGLSQRVRLKLGSGEPMQRQGGYYGEVSGQAAFLHSETAARRYASHLRESTRRSTVYATTPMLGVFAEGDLRTFQSAISEHVRYLSINDFAQLLHHLTWMQSTHRRDLTRASEELADSRLKSTSRGEQALERLTIGTRDAALDSFLDVLTENFRQILYGRDEDVVGIHIISYFIARTTPPLRDRPTARTGLRGKEQGNRILERIAETIPFSRYGSLLRAIAHNQAQTSILGINQLTTGLFRALDTFSRQGPVDGGPETFLSDRILPHLPVHEILQSLRLYHEVETPYLRLIERAFPAGNSSFLALREDLDAMTKYLPLFQQELIRRHGIDVSDFFRETQFIPDLLPTLRPDLAVLLQPDIFNTGIDRLHALIGGSLESSWMAEVRRLLDGPAEIRQWRSRAWALLEKPVYQRVQAFVELAVSLYSISSKNPVLEGSVRSGSVRLPSSMGSFFRMSRIDDEMRQFLAAATEYLTLASEGMVEVPANIIRAMKEVERIAAIEEQALTAEQQDRLRFYLLQIARVAGENG